jgi:hypothetical protein
MTQDIRILLTNPIDAENPNSVSPFDIARPERLVFFCFFKQGEQRTDFLARLRHIAATAPSPDADRAALHETLSAQYARLQQQGESLEAFYVAIEWWAGAMRRGYHAYSLKIGFAPYRTSCVVAFRELETESLKRNVERALRCLEEEKGRMLDFFGLGERE